MATPNNENKLITITPTSGSQNSSWGTLLSGMIESVTRNNSPDGFIVNDASKYNVRPEIYLTMDDTGLPVYKTENTYDSAIRNSLEILGNFGAVGKLASNGYNAVKNLVGGAINIGSAFMTDAQRDESGVITDNSNISATFNPWIENVPAWINGDVGRDFEYTFKFSMGQYGLWDAREEVVNPILNLMAPTMQRMITSWSVVSPYPNQYQMIKEIFSSMFSNLGSGTAAEAGGTSFFTNLSEKILAYYNSFTYTVKFGNMYTFYNMLIKNSEINFATETDDNGNPISGSIKLTFTNIIPSALSYKDGAKSFTIKY